MTTKCTVGASVCSIAVLWEAEHHEVRTTRYARTRQRTGSWRLCGSRHRRALGSAGEPLAAIRIINGTNDQLHAVLISDCSASTYGLNRLPRGLAIPAGGSYDITVSSGCWDVAGGTIGVGDARGRIRVGPGQTFSFTII